MNADPYQICLITVDGTDFLVQEPSPFDPDYFSHKFDHAGLRYEVGICIKTGWIVWVNGPFPCGAWPDLRIARSSLHYMLDAGEMYVADGGYTDDYGYSINPDGTHSFEQRQYATARARHEQVNSCFKTYNCMRVMWRHDREKHGIVFYAVATIVHLGISLGNLTFTVQYDEAEFE